MTAECWSCEMRVSHVSSRAERLRVPVGSCWECGVFGCTGHGHRDGGSGKWVCYPSVAKALATSAGLMEAPRTLAEGRPRTRIVFTDVADFRERFPELAQAVAEGHDRRVEGLLGAALNAAGPLFSNPELGQLAVEVSVFLVAGPVDDEIDVREWAPGARRDFVGTALGRRLGRLVADAWDQVDPTGLDT